MNNYEFCADWAIRKLTSSDMTVLDYGCGEGQIVELLRAKGVNAFGCDIFYEGGDYSKNIKNSMFEQKIIRRMDGNTIPFPDASIDLITCNQVMEHVPDMDIVLKEIQRVLKPGGQMLSLFPDRSVVREGHCGIPLLHWFPKKSSARVYYAAMLRGIGLGYHKGEKSVMQWSRDICVWLDNWTYYRPISEIRQKYLTAFTDLHFIEPEWLDKRIGKRHPITRFAPKFLKTLIVRKLGSLVFVATK